MTASSLSVPATAAIATCSNCLISSTPVDHHRHISLCPVPRKAKPIKAPLKIINFLSYSPIPRSSVFCAPSAFDSVGLNEEDEDTEIGVEQTAPEVEGEDDETGRGRLYVGNLPFSMTSAQLSEIFAEAGRVVSVEIVYDRVTDRSRGFAFITMATVEEGKEAIRLFNGSQIGGRSAKVNFPEVPRGGEREVMSPKRRSSNQGFVDSPHKIYAGNLSWNLTSQALKEVFAEQPGFLSAKVIFDRDSGRSRGFGFITFSTAEDVESSLNSLNGLEVEGRPLRLDLAEQKLAAAAASPVESVPENNLETSEVILGASA